MSRASTPSPSSSSSRRLATLLAVALATVTPLWAAPAHAQQGSVFSFDWTFDTTEPTLLLSGADGSATVHATFFDNSLDLPPAVGVGLYAHSVLFSVTPTTTQMGWSAQVKPSAIYPHSGDKIPFEISFGAGGQATAAYYQVTLTAAITTEDGNTTYLHTKLEAYDPGVTTFSIIPIKSPPSTMAPREIGTGRFQIHNVGLQPASFQVALTDNSCDMSVGYPGTLVVDQKSVAEYSIQIQAPDSKHFYLLGDQCSVSFLVSNVDFPGRGPQPITYTVTVQGVSADPYFIFQILVVLLLILLLILLIRRRKDRLEEQILGKPQKPWLIPVERVYLAELKQRDPRAWYVVRHYLMEEEYRSSLLWFKAYKKATKGDRKKERLILKEERKYEKWKAAWAKAIAKPIKKADRFEAKLQRKLDRKAGKAFRKASRKVAKQTRQINAAHAKLQAKALEKWEKQAARAEKKGRPIPVKPVAAPPDLPEKPVLAKRPLADHRWSKKAARFRRRKVRKQGNLEVRFEKADTRYLNRLRRKVSRIGRKLDDPTFVDEHPLLSKTAKQA